MEFVSEDEEEVKQEVKQEEEVKQEVKEGVKEEVKEETQQNNTPTEIPSETTLHHSPNNIIDELPEIPTISHDHPREQEETTPERVLECELFIC